MHKDCTEYIQGSVNDASCTVVQYVAVVLLDLASPAGKLGPREFAARTDLPSWRGYLFLQPMYREPALLAKFKHCTITFAHAVGGRTD